MINSIKVLLLIIIISVVWYPYITIIEKNIEIDYLKKHYEIKIITLKDKIKKEKQKNNFLKERLKKHSVTYATITWYHPNSGGINSDGNPTHTATMTRPTVGRTIAISTKLVQMGWLGKKIYIEGYGVFTAEDRMNVNLKGSRIDICAASKKVAINNGKLVNIFCCKLN